MALQARRTTASQPTSRRGSKDAATGQRPVGKLVTPFTRPDPASSLYTLLRAHGDGPLHNGAAGNSTAEQQLGASDLHRSGSALRRSRTGLGSSSKADGTARPRRSASSGT